MSRDENNTSTVTSYSQDAPAISSHEVGNSTVDIDNSQTHESNRSGRDVLYAAGDVLIGGDKAIRYASGNGDIVENSANKTDVSIDNTSDNINSTSVGIPDTKFADPGANQSTDKKSNKKRSDITVDIGNIATTALIAISGTGILLSARYLSEAEAIGICIVIILALSVAVRGINTLRVKAFGNKADKNRSAANTEKSGITENTGTNGQRKTGEDIQKNGASDPSAGDITYVYSEAASISTPRLPATDSSPLWSADNAVSSGQPDVSDGIESFMTDDAYRFPINDDDPWAGYKKSLNTIFDRSVEERTARKELIRNVAHEIRTPIANLQLVAEGLQDGIFSLDDDYSIHQILDSVNRVSTTVKMMSDYASQSQLERRSEKCDLRKCIATAEGLAAERNEIAGGGVEISVVVSADVPSIGLMGQNDLDTVLSALIDNAFRHAHGMHTLSVELSESTIDDTCGLAMAAICVRDDGCGSDPRNARKMTEPFWKGDESHTCATDGDTSPGMGLSVSKEIMKRAGGDIEITCGVGTGVEVLLLVPIASNASSEAEAYSERGENSSASSAGGNTTDLAALGLSEASIEKVPHSYDSNGELLLG